MAGSTPELDAARAQVSAVEKLARALAAAHTMDAVADAIVETVGPTVDAMFSVVAVASPDEQELRLHLPAAIASDIASDIASSWVTVPLDKSTPLGAAVVTGRTARAADTDAIGKMFPRGAADAERLGVHSLTAYPIGVADGTVRAAIGLGWSYATTEPEPEPEPEPDDARDDVPPVIALAGAALRRAWISDEGRRLTALLETLLQQAPIGLAFIDPDLRFSHINERLAEMNGRPAAEHLGRSIFEMLPALAGQIVPVLRRVFAQGEPLARVEISGEVPASPGLIRVWEGSFYPVRTPDGVVFGAGLVVVEVTRQREEQARLREFAVTERAIAQRLQAGLLPTSTPDVDGYEIRARYEAGTAGLRVGGDWYEVVEIRPGDIAIVVGDAVGHDLDAAIAMSQIRNALTGLGHAHDDPAAVVEHLDEYAVHTPDAFASTLFYARLKPSTGELSYTLAGHHPPLLVHHDGRHDWLDAEPGPPIGVSGTRRTTRCQLAIGDCLIGYTDGLIEHHREPIERGRRRLVDTSIAGAAGPLDRLVESLLTSVPHPERPDDIVVLALRRITSGV